MIKFYKKTFPLKIKLLVLNQNIFYTRSFNLHYLPLIIQCITQCVKIIRDAQRDILLFDIICDLPWNDKKETQKCIIIFSILYLPFKYNKLLSL